MTAVTGLRSAALAAFSGLGVCLPLTAECADHYAEIVAERRRSGRPVGSMDALVAAIVRESGGRLATRDTNDFAGLGLDLVNPWRTIPRCPDGRGVDEPPAVCEASSPPQPSGPNTPLTLTASTTRGQGDDQA